MSMRINRSCVVLFFSDACRQRCRQGARFSPSPHWSDTRHPPGDAHRRCWCAGHCVRLPSPNLCCQPLPYWGEWRHLDANGSVPFSFEPRLHPFSFCLFVSIICDLNTGCSLCASIRFSFRMCSIFLVSKRHISSQTLRCSSVTARQNTQATVCSAYFILQLLTHKYASRFSGGMVKLGAHRLS